MRRVVVDMQNALFADAIATALRNFDSDFEVYQSESPAKTTDMCVFTEANILIMEVTAYTPWKLEERMKIRAELKKTNPDCKIVLVVDENTEKKLADKVRQAKKDGLIDSFIYRAARCPQRRRVQLPVRGRRYAERCDADSHRRSALQRRLSC